MPSCQAICGERQGRVGAPGPGRPTQNLPWRNPCGGGGGAAGRPSQAAAHQAADQPPAPWAGLWPPGPQAHPPARTYHLLLHTVVPDGVLHVRDGREELLRHGVPAGKCPEPQPAPGDPAGACSFPKATPRVPLTMATSLSSSLCRKLGRRPAHAANPASLAGAGGETRGTPEGGVGSAGLPHSASTLPTKGPRRGAAGTVGTPRRNAATGLPSRAGEGSQEHGPRASWVGESAKFKGTMLGASGDNTQVHQAAVCVAPDTRKGSGEGRNLKDAALGTSSPWPAGSRRPKPGPRFGKLRKDACRLRSPGTGGRASDSVGKTRTRWVRAEWTQRGGSLLS